MARAHGGALTRSLALRHVFALSPGAMLSSGLFLLPGLAVAKAGPAAILAYLIAGLLAVPAMLSVAELASALPKAGGAYYFLERALGPSVGTVAGLGTWLSLVLKDAFALVGMGAFIALLFPNLTEMELRYAAAGCCLFFVGVNILGAKHAGRAQIVMVAGLMVVLLLYIVTGIGHIDTTCQTGTTAPKNRISPAGAQRSPSAR